MPATHATLRCRIAGLWVRAVAVRVGREQRAAASIEGQVRTATVVRRVGRGRKLAELCGVAVRRLVGMQ